MHLGNWAEESGVLSLGIWTLTIDSAVVTVKMFDTLAIIKFSCLQGSQNSVSL